VTGAYHAVSYLIARGHTHIGLIGSTLTGPEHPSKRARREGYLKALTDHGIEQHYIEDSVERHASSYHATLQLLERAPQITAIFACSDTIGRQVIQAVEDSGLRVPDDVSLVGFDDTEASAVSRPTMTTMHVDKELMGTLAVRQLHDQATNRNRVSISLMMGTKLIERESVLWRNPETT
jgi:LacI family transcriptional regulator